MEFFKFSLDEFYDFIKNIYVFQSLKLYLKDKTREEDELAFATIFCILTGLFTAFTMFKIFIIIIYFFVIQLISSLVAFCQSLKASKGQKNFCISLKNGFLYLRKIIKKAFTYNFYEFDNILIGAIYVIGFIAYLFVNFLFMISVSNNLGLDDKSRAYQILHLCAIELSISIEIFCIIFYEVKDMKKQLLICIGYIFIMNFVIFLGFFFEKLLINKYGYFERDQPKCITNLIINLIFLIMYIGVIIKLSLYNPRKEALKILFEEKKLFYKGQPTVTDKEYSKLDEASKKYDITTIFYTRDNHNPFKRKDRYAPKFRLIALYSLLTITSGFSFAYNILLFTKDQEDISGKMMFKILSMIHLLAVLLLGNLTYVKIKTKTQIFF